MCQTFDVFLSHNSLDKPVVEDIGGLLKQRGLRVWLDSWELVPGRPWQEALEEVIRKAKSAVVFVGGEGIGPWQQPEMRAVLSQFVKNGLPVIPVLLPEAPSKVELPLFLGNFTWVDFRSGLSEKNIDRLVWGISGSKPDKEVSEKRYADLEEKLMHIPKKYCYNGLRFISFSSDGSCKSSSEIQRKVNNVAEQCKIGWNSRGSILSKKNVNIRSKKFFMSEACITNNEYWIYIKSVGVTDWPKHWMRSLVSENGFPFPSVMANLPVVNISFAEAKAFARHVGARLPIADERTLAVSGSSGFLYPWGDDFNPGFCNGKEGRKNKVVSVDSYSQGNTVEGIRQLVGNVSEWVLMPDGTPAVGGGSYLELCEYWGIGYVYRKMDANERRCNIGFRLLRNEE